MQYCPKCKIRIQGNKSCCPLCQGRITGEAEQSPFPVTEKPQISSLSFLRIATFAAVCVLVALLLASYLSQGRLVFTGLLQLITVLALADVWVVFYFRSNAMKMVTVQLYLIILLTVVIDLRTGMHGWSFAWLAPFAFPAVLFAVILIGKASGMTLENYIIYLVWDILFSLLQLIPIRLGLNPFPQAAAISIAFLLIAGTALVLFRFRELRSAGGKWFHM